MKSYYCVEIGIILAVLAIAQGFPTTKERKIHPGHTAQHVLKQLGHMIKSKNNVGPAKKGWLPPPHITKQVAKKQEDGDECWEMYTAITNFVEAMQKVELESDAVVSELFGGGFDIDNSDDVYNISCLLVELADNLDYLPDEVKESFYDSMNQFKEYASMMKVPLDQGLLDGTEYKRVAVAIVELYEVFNKNGLIRADDEEY